MIIITGKRLDKIISTAYRNTIREGDTIVLFYPTIMRRNVKYSHHRLEYYGSGKVKDRDLWEQDRITLTTVHSGGKEYNGIMRDPDNYQGDTFFAIKVEDMSKKERVELVTQRVSV